MPITAKLYDGTELSFPDGTDPAVMQDTVKRMTAARQSGATSDMDMRHGGKVDKEYGGNALMRALVGKETDMGRKQQILSRFHPYVAQEGPDNFVVGDESGKRYLFNPPGFDPGDVAGAAREIAQGAAGVGAGVATAGAGPFIAAPASAATSAVAGQQFDRLADGTANLVLRAQGKDPIPNKNIFDQMKEAGIETAAGTVGDLGLRGMGKVVGKVLNPVSQRLSDVYARLGATPPSIGAVSEGSFWPAIEKATSRLALGDDLLKASEKGGQIVANGLERGAKTITPDIAISGDDLGSRILSKVAGEKKALGQWYEQAMDDAVGDLTHVPGKLENTLKWIDDVAGEMSMSGQGEASQAFRDKLHSLISDQIQDATGKSVATGLVDQAGNPILRATPPELNVPSLKRLRTVLQEQIEKMPELTTGKVGQGAVKRLRSVLQQDLLDSLPEDAKPGYLAVQKAYGQRGEALDAMEKFFGGNRTPQQVGDIVSKADVDPEKLRMLQTMPNYGEDALDEITAYQAKNMGKAGPGARDPNSPAKTVTNANKMLLERPETGDLLFGGQIPQDVRDALELAAVMDKQNSIYGNPSGTAQALESIKTMKGVGSAVLGAGGGLLGASGISPGTAAAVAASLAVPYATAKFATSPKVIETMSRPGYQAFWDALATGDNPVSANLGRFAGLMSERRLNSE